MVLARFLKFVKLAICLCDVKYNAMFRSVTYACLHALMYLHVHLFAYMLIWFDGFACLCIYVFYGLLSDLFAHPLT